MAKHLDDHVTLIDDLGREELLKEVVTHVREAPLPTVIGIHGDWGSGKSSFLLQLEAVLTNFKQREGESVVRAEYVKKAKKSLKAMTDLTHPVVWFEAWRYQHDPQPVIALLHEIRKQMSPAKKVGLKLDRFARNAIEGALSSIDGLTAQYGVKLDPKAYRQISDRHRESNYEVPQPTVALNEVLDTAIKTIVTKYTGDNGVERLVVLIDDLDRCDAEMARKLLDGLKVFLQLKNCVFVIAMDEAVITEFLTREDGKSKTGEVDTKAQQRARRYMEKICQGHYRLSFVNDTKNYFMTCLRRIEMNDRLIKSLDRVITQQADLPPNPRKLKLLAQSFRHLSMRIEKAMGGFDDYKLDRHVALALVIAYCYQFETRMYRLIEVYKNDFFQELITAVSKDDSPKKIQADWGDMIIPRGFQAKPDDWMPDPILSGMFYPTGIVRRISTISRPMIELIIGAK